MQTDWYEEIDGLKAYAIIGIVLIHVLANGEYRVLEKLHLVHLFGNGLLAYIFTAVAVICGSVVFSVCAKWILCKIGTLIVGIKRETLQ